MLAFFLLSSDPHLCIETHVRITYNVHIHHSHSYNHKRTEQIVLLTKIYVECTRIIRTLCLPAKWANWSNARFPFFFLGALSHSTISPLAICERNMGHLRDIKTSCGGSFARLISSVLSCSLFFHHTDCRQIGCISIFACHLTGRQIASASSANTL